MAHRHNVSTIGNAQLVQLRTLLDQYIAKHVDNPIAEHKGECPALC